MNGVRNERPDGERFSDHRRRIAAPDELKMAHGGTAVGLPEDYH
jgi:hypothetical protein